MKGRKPTPAKVTALRGNPGKRKKVDNAPHFDVAIPQPPDHLSADALLIWDETAREMEAKQIVTRLDEAALALYCQVYADLKAHTIKARSEEEFVESKRGMMQMNPRLRYIRNLQEQLIKIAAELGITPVARNKVKMIGKGPAQPTKEEKLAEKLFKLPVAK